MQIGMLAALERHILVHLNFKINMPTPLDFALFYAHRAFDVQIAQALVYQSLPFIYLVVCDYNLSRGLEPSVIGLASIFFTIQ